MKKNLITFAFLMFCGFLSSGRADTITSIGGCSLPGGCTIQTTTDAGKVELTSMSGFFVNGINYTITFDTFTTADSVSEYQNSLFYDPTALDDNDDFNAISDIADALNSYNLSNPAVTLIDPVTNALNTFYILANPIPGSGGSFHSGDDAWVTYVTGKWGGADGSAMNNGTAHDGDIYAIFTQTPVSTPEPSSLALFGTGIGLLFAFAIMRRRKLTGQSSL